MMSILYFADQNQSCNSALTQVLCSSAKKRDIAGTRRFHGCFNVKMDISECERKRSVFLLET